MSRQDLQRNSPCALLAETQGGAASKGRQGELIDELILVPEHGQDGATAESAASAESAATAESAAAAVPSCEPALQSESLTVGKLGEQKLTYETAQAPLAVELAMSIEDAAQQDISDPFALGPDLELKSMVGVDLEDNKILSEGGAWLASANKNTNLSSIEGAVLVANKMPEREEQTVKTPRKKRSSAKAEAMDAMPLLLDFDDDEFKDSEKILKPQSQSAYQKEQAAKMAQAKFLAELQAAQEATKEVYNPLQYCNQLFSDDDFDDTDGAGNDGNAAEAGGLSGTEPNAPLNNSGEGYPRLAQDNVKFAKRLSRELVYSFTERRFYTKMPRDIFCLSLMMLVVALDAEGDYWIDEPTALVEMQFKAWRQWRVDEQTLQLKILSEESQGQMAPAQLGSEHQAPAKLEPVLAPEDLAKSEAAPEPPMVLEIQADATTPVQDAKPATETTVEASAEANAEATADATVEATAEPSAPVPASAAVEPAPAPQAKTEPAGESDADPVQRRQASFDLIGRLKQQLAKEFAERHFYTKMSPYTFEIVLIVLFVTVDGDCGAFKGPSGGDDALQIEAWRQWMVNPQTLQLKILEGAPAPVLTPAPAQAPAAESEPESEPKVEPTVESESESEPKAEPAVEPASEMMAEPKVESEPKSETEPTGNAVPDGQTQLTSSAQQSADNAADLNDALELLSKNQLTTNLVTAFQTAQASLQELKLTLQVGKVTSFVDTGLTSAAEHDSLLPVNAQGAIPSDSVELRANSGMDGTNIANEINLDNGVNCLADSQEIILADHKDLLNWVQRSVQHKDGLCKMDLENLLKMQIAASILEDISRDDFVELLSEVFMVNGYTTLICGRNDTALPEIDLLLSSGKLGFGGSKVCVKLSYSIEPISRMVLDEFNGLVKKYQAEYGILISPSGFKKSFPPEICREFFKLQCWDMQRVVNEILECYPKLSVTAQKILPLQQIWIVDN